MQAKEQQKEMVSTPLSVSSRVDEVSKYVYFERKEDVLRVNLKVRNNYEPVTYSMKVNRGLKTSRFEEDKGIINWDLEDGKCSIWITIYLDHPQLNKVHILNW